MHLKIRKLHPNFGIIVENINLDTVTKENLYPEIRELFEEHSVLLFKNQSFSEQVHINLAKLFGPLENREAMAKKSPIPFELPKVSNQNSKGCVFEETHMRMLDLKGNMLWHTDSTFLPIPALANIIAAKIIPSTGGETELASTRVPIKNLPKQILEKIKNRKFFHSFVHSRKQIDPALATMNKISRWKPQKWNSIIENPVNGKKSIYIASHAYKLEGFSKAESQKIINKIISVATQKEAVYSHRWHKGDVLIWDERSILHRGRPWPYNEIRTLASICVSLSPEDGLPNVPKSEFN